MLPAQMWGSAAETELSLNFKAFPALFCLKMWTTLKSGSSTWLFPEHCLEEMRGDVVRSRKKRGDVSLKNLN